MASRIQNIHDKFVKELLSRKELSIAFLKSFLPPEVANRLDFESLEYQHTSYLSEELASSYSDMVWRVKLIDTGSMRICVLLEHKSRSEPFVAFQLLRYLALGYEKQLKEQKKVTDLILPILYYHGREKWEFQSLAAHFDTYSPFFRKYIPTFKFSS